MDEVRFDERHFESFADTREPGGERERTDATGQNHRFRWELAKPSHRFQVHAGASVSRAGVVELLYAVYVRHTPADYCGNFRVGRANRRPEGLGFHAQIHG